MAKVKPDGHKWAICLLFFSCQPDHFWLRYSKFHIWPWKYKVKVIAKVKPNGHIEALSSIDMFAFPMVTFDAQSFIDLFSFRLMAIGPLLAEI